jgi:hypothetical protein
MTVTFELTGIEDAAFSEDRKQVEVRLRTDRGELTLRLDGKHLAELITCLLDLEYHASFDDPDRGRIEGEHLLRASVVDEYRVECGLAEGVPSIFLGLRSGEARRWFALPEAQATGLEQALAAEIPRLREGRLSH